jgi:hypothetical protein
MREIQLSQGQIALVDDADFPLLSEFHWCYRPERDGKQGYVIRHQKAGGKYKTVYLHRHIMQPPEGHEVIFLNYDRLDCRRENLKVVTKEEARRHHRVRSDSRSGVKGVRYNAEGDSWSAYVYRGGNAYHVGTYYSQEQAVAAYEDELKKENPDLHRAPARVDRQRTAESAQACGPGAA